jgi:class 3 adenylate cyclase
VREIFAAANIENEHFYYTLNYQTESIARYVYATKATWPFIELNDFELRGTYSEEVASFKVLGMSPLVSEESRAAYEEFTTLHQGWIKEGLITQGYNSSVVQNVPNISSVIFDAVLDENLRPREHIKVESPQAGFETAVYLPWWQQAPAPTDPRLINFDLLRHPVFKNVFQSLWESQESIMSETFQLTSSYAEEGNLGKLAPHSLLMHPIYDYTPDKIEFSSSDIVGVLFSVFEWGFFFQDVLPFGKSSAFFSRVVIDPRLIMILLLACFTDVNGIQVVVIDSCGHNHTYELHGPRAVYLGEGDMHDPQFESLRVVEAFHANNDEHEHCNFSFHFYPTSKLQQQYSTSKPALYCAVVVCVFAFTVFAFILYDYLVQRRQNLVMATAKRTDAIVSSLFPKHVRDRIIEDAQAHAIQETKSNQLNKFLSLPKNQLKSFLDKENDHVCELFSTKPIAELFPETTILFADIVGFTAWSSIREPSQVFTLLETIYHSFDTIARRRRVFKVETVGDCYVAVTGLPEPQPDHAVIMARFAKDVLARMHGLTKQLELTLGPDTGELTLRIGLHSGPVTAGVLRGEKSRFQLFGDTVNTASRIESTGKRGKIHLSSETAECLCNIGKSNWVVDRNDAVEAKGKGVLKTYWLKTNDDTQQTSVTHSSSGSSVTDPTNVDDIDVIEAIAKIPATVTDSKTQRLVEWNTEVLARLLKLIIARRATNTHQSETSTPNENVNFHWLTGSVLDEVKEIIHLPDFNATCSVDDLEAVTLEENVMNQLHSFITSSMFFYFAIFMGTNDCFSLFVFVHWLANNMFFLSFVTYRFVFCCFTLSNLMPVAALYHDPHFHNFEHASHVTMSVAKLLSRIVAPDIVMDTVDDEHDENKRLAMIHDHTYGITSDPLTQFACVFSALIHDVDHTGVPNTQLMKENPTLAAVYHHRSVAEQNSVDIAWKLLMSDDYCDLRRVLYQTNEEFHRFRELVVNSIMATDIMDVELKKLRNARWDRAFNQCESSRMEPVLDTVHRKATIVIEHLIQASDVCHTMQHWHIYRKWNERLFREMYQAYCEGRSDSDPSEFWYKGEIGFFDYYIIPLAKKLKDCGVFGVSSDEYLNYALKNRQEWEARGEEIVAAMMEKMNASESN